MSIPPVHPRRIHPLNSAAQSGGPVVYWMSREQRARDNWGLLHARHMAGEGRPVVGAFCLTPGFLGATLRQYDFMLRGLEETARELAEASIPFVLLPGDPGEEIVRFARSVDAGAVVTDFDPLRVKRGWQDAAAEALDVPFIEVDGHNVVPARVVSDKQEYAARTIRPKLHRLMSEYLEDFPDLVPNAASSPDLPTPDWKSVRASLEVDETVKPAALTPGGAAAEEALGAFVANRLKDYAEGRNDPNAGATSGLSAYFHFGQLAPQRAALEVSRSGETEGRDAYIEELVVRRELTDNFCLHNPDYDSLNGAPDWGRKTLDEHRDDERPYIYSYAEFDEARTHSDLWNAAQLQMRETGYMHGYLRMFWAKKILEWSRIPEEAVETAVALNDRYELDGRDPNGYVGVLWSVAGLHDRPWKRRAVYGGVRYMNENGCRRKFDVPAYIKRYGATSNT